MALAWLDLMGTTPVERPVSSWFKPWNPLYRDLADRFLLARRFLPVKGTVVEAGCGAGFGAKIMKISPPEIHYFGFDVSVEAIQEARGLADWGLFFVASILCPPIVSETADLTICFETLEHLECSQQPDALRELARITRSGGTLLVSVPSRQFHVGLPNPFHIGLRDDDDWRDLIARSRWRIERLFGQNRVWHKGYLIAKHAYRLFPLLGRLLWLPHAYLRCLLHIPSVESYRAGRSYRNLLFQCTKT